MNPKGRPRGLDSKTSCLRITVPENLELALEGLIRKVLRDQPKTDDIYSFAANYFETLLKIRDKAGAKFTAAQLCPFHEDEEAREMIILAGTLSKQAAERSRRKEEDPVLLKTKTFARKKKIDKTAPDKGLKKSRGTTRSERPEEGKKQATPDLIKKLPPRKATEGGQMEKAKTRDDREGSEAAPTKQGQRIDEEFLTSDPIKEFVEREFLMATNSSVEEGGGKGPESSEKNSVLPIAIGGQRPGPDETVGKRLAESTASEANTAGAEATEKEREGSGDAGRRAAKRNVFGETKEVEEKATDAAEAARDSEDSAPAAEGREPEGRRLLQEMQPKEGERTKEKLGNLQTAENSENENESERTKEIGPEFLDGPLPGEPAAASVAAENDGQGLVVRELAVDRSGAARFASDLEDRGAARRETSPEIIPPPQETYEIRDGGGKSRAGALPRQAPSVEAEEGICQLLGEGETGDALSHVAPSPEGDPVNKNRALAAETANCQSKEVNVRESSAQDEGAIDELANEQPSGGRDPNEKEEAAKKGSEIEGDPSGPALEEETLRQTSNADSDGSGEIQDADADDPSTFPVEEGKRSTSTDGADETEKNGNVTGSTDSFGPAEEKAAEPPEKLDRVGEKRSKATSGTEQFPDPTDSEDAVEIKRNTEDGEVEKEKKLSDEQAKAKSENSGEGRQIPDEQKSLAECSPAGEISGSSEAAPEKEPDSHDREGVASGPPKSEVQEAAKEQVPVGGSSSTAHAAPSSGSVVDGEAAAMAAPEREGVGSPEFEPEAVTAGEGETPLPAEEEPCSVVDVLWLAKRGVPDEGRQDIKPAEPQPRTDADEKPTTEMEEPRSSTPAHDPPSEEKTLGEDANENFNLPPESEADHIQKAETETESEGRHDATSALRAEAHSQMCETEREKADSEGRLAPDIPGLWTRFARADEADHRSETGKSGPPENGRHVVVIEEPEAADENPEAPAATGEIQIKTIQTHYYDALRVPEILTGEYRVHGVAVPPVGGFLVAPSPSDREREGSSRELDVPSELSDDGPPQKTSLDEDDGISSSVAATEASPRAELAETGALEPAGNARGTRTETLPAVGRLDQDAQASRSDDPPGRTGTSSDGVPSFSEFNSINACETFLSNERGFSSLEKEETRHVRLEEVVPATPLATLDSPAPPRETEEVKEKAAGESPPDSGDLTDERAAGGDPPTFSEVRGTLEDLRSPSTEVEPGRATEVLVDGSPLGPATPDVEAERSDGGTRDKRDSEPGGEEARGEMAAAEDPSGESDSTASSAATEIKRADSGRKSFASAPSLSSSRSLDSEKRNRLVRSTSLSAHRLGVADSEVWSAIAKELEEAATKIQSKYRGYKAKKKLRRENAVQITTEESSTRTTPVEAEGDDRRRATGEFHDSIVLSDHPR